MACVFFSERPIDKLLIDVDVDSAGVKCYTRYSDLELILDEQRLKRLGSASSTTFLDDVRKHLSKSSPNSVPLSDDDILSYVSSRRIQRPSEVKEWSDFLSGLDEYRRSRIPAPGKVSDVKDDKSEKKETKFD